MQDESYVKSVVVNGVCTIEFYHPKGNSLPAKLLELLAQEIYSASNNDNARVLVIRSGGNKSFCAGASFDELAGLRNEDEGQQFFNGFGQVINAMRKSPKLIIVRIHGKCVGGGVGIAAAADYAIAAGDADVKLSELSIGIGPFVIGPAVERKIGLSAFSALAIDSSMWRNADWARRKGLYAELHPSVEDMDESIGRLADSLSHSSPEAMREIKKMLWAGTEHWDELLAARAAISGRLILNKKTV